MGSESLGSFCIHVTRSWFLSLAFIALRGSRAWRTNYLCKANSSAVACGRNGDSRIRKKLHGKVGCACLSSHNVWPNRVENEPCREYGLKLGIVVRPCTTMCFQQHVNLIAKQNAHTFGRRHIVFMRRPWLQNPLPLVVTLFHATPGTLYSW